MSKAKAKKTAQKKSFPCSECPKTFTSQWNLTRHETCVHKDLKLFGCDKCDKSYKRKRDLDGHINSKHLKQLPYVCDICNAAFPRRETLRTHAKTHSDERAVRPRVRKRSRKSMRKPTVQQATAAKVAKVAETISSCEAAQHRRLVVAAEGDKLVLHNGHIDAVVDGRVFSLGFDDHGALHEHVDDCDDCSEGAPDDEKQEHVHGDNCGHERIQHDDHWDWLVGHHLHHPTGSGCENHGHVPRLTFEDAMEDQSWQELFAANDLAAKLAPPVDTMQAIDRLALPLKKTPDTNCRFETTF